MSNGIEAVWKVQVNSVFFYANEMFYPGVQYHVTDALYNGKIADGRNFADLCATAQQENRPT